MKQNNFPCKKQKLTKSAIEAENEAITESFDAPAKLEFPCQWAKPEEEAEASENNISEITQRENDLNEAMQAVRRFADALDEFEQVQDSIQRLEKYYGSHTWFQALKVYENGALPPELKCGVLSEDLIYNLLMENDELARRMQSAAQQILDKSREDVSG